MLKLLVFDLDGTLVDTVTDLGNSLNHALQKAGYPILPMATVKGLVGDGARILVERSLKTSRSLAAPNRDMRMDSASEFQEILETVLQDFLEHYNKHYLVESTVYPGVLDALQSLTRYRKAVLTNKPGEPARQLLAGLGLSPFFEWILGGDNPFGIKPNPGALNHLLSLASAEPGQAVMIGDGIQDLRVAQKAGTHFLGFLNGMGDRDSLLAGQPEAILEDMHLLSSAIAEISSSSTPSSSGFRKPGSGVFP